MIPPFAPLPLPPDWTAADVAAERARVRAELEAIAARVFARLALRRAGLPAPDEAELLRAQRALATERKGEAA